MRLVKICHKKKPYAKIINLVTTAESKIICASKEIITSLDIHTSVIQMKINDPLLLKIREGRKRNEYVNPSF